MYVINPAPGSQDLPIAPHRPDSPEALGQQQRQDILSQILTQCNADMSEQGANFSSPAEKTPPRTLGKDEPHPSPPASPNDAPGLKPPADAAEPNGGDRAGSARSPAAPKRSSTPDGSPLSTASSFSPSPSAGRADAAAEPPAALSRSPVPNFSSVVHPKERALKSIAADAAANERTPAAGTPEVGSGKPASGKFPAGGRPVSNGTTGAAVHGGRLQFFKDGKFILELARAREGEKTSWISVPRKTFWPPTVSSTSANFHKHESSTSLSFSDDNSSIQSSPWQRDHCWKQANPRANISKELSLYYFRPRNARVRVARESRTWLRRKRRRPYESTLPPDGNQGDAGAPSSSDVDSKVKQEKEAKDEGNDKPSDGSSPAQCNGVAPMDTSDPATAPSEEDEEDGEKKPKDVRLNGPTEEEHKHTNGHHPLTNGSHHHRAARSKRRGGAKDLAAIVQTLAEQQQAKSTAALLSSGSGGAAVGPFRLGTITERGTNGAASFRSSVFASSSASQHVSPRKRILRELEKVSLDDGGSGGTTSTKRSRPKSSAAVGTPVIVTATTATPLSTLTTNGTGSPLNGSNSSSSSSSSSRSNGHHNGGAGSNGATGKPLTNGAGSSSPASGHPPPAPVSRPFSSYSITSLLGHGSGGDASSSAGSSGGEAGSRKGESSVASVTSTASHHLYHHSQQPAAPPLPPSPYQQPKSPTMVDAHHHAHYPTAHGSIRYGYGVKKRSPSYGGSAASPGATSAGSGGTDPYGGTIRSPDLSPSPEHHPHHHAHHSAHPAQHHLHHHASGGAGTGGAGFVRYRQHPYGGSPGSYSSLQSSSRFSPSPSTNDSTTTPPYSGSGTAPGSSRTASSYRAAYHLGGSGSQGHSPPAPNGSPQHYSRASPLNFGRGGQLSSPPPPPGAHHPLHAHHPHHRAGATSSSPRGSPSGGSTAAATTPTSASSAIRTVPKKTAALRQPFAGGHSPSSSSSPSRERSNSNASSSSAKKDSHPDGADSVDGHYPVPPSSSASTSTPSGVIRPSTVIASPAVQHPVTNPFYPLYPAQLPVATTPSSMNAAAVAAAAAAAAAASSVPFHPATLYYQQMYTAATMAAYRAPLWMHYPGLPAVSPHGSHLVPPGHLPPVATMTPTTDRRHDRTPTSPPPPAQPPPPASGHSDHPPHAGPLPTSSAALNYSVTALTTSSRPSINGGSAFSSPAGSNWPPGAVGGYPQPPQHPDHSIATSTASATATATAVKEEPNNDVPLNLSKH